MEWAIYFLGIVSKVEEVTCLFSVFIGLGLLLLGFVMVCEVNTSYYKWDDDNVKVLLRWFIRGCYTFAVILGIYFVVPNSKTLAAMYVIPAITQNEQLRHISENSLQALEKLTQKWIQDIASENTK